MLSREGRYWSRLVVPMDLRPHLEDRTELRKPLGADYRQAGKAHHGAVAELQHRIAEAERAAARAKGRPVEGRARYPMKPEALALAHYRSRLALDDYFRTDPRWANMSVDDGLVAQLRAGIAGRLDDDALEAVVGDRFERFRALGNVDMPRGSPEWRTAARALCVAEYEALARVVERDEGDFAGAPAHPMVAQVEKEPDPPSAVSLRKLFRDYVKARAAVGRGSSTERRWAPVVESLVKHVQEDDVRKVTKGELLTWRDRLLEGGLSATTVSGVYLGAIKAILRWAHENDRLPTNAAEGVRQAKAKKPRAREAGYTDAEAVALLKAARAYVPKVGATKSTTEGAELTRAKR